MSQAKGPERFIFTITPGHTGTTYLSRLLSDNIADSVVHHEILRYDAFGVDTPDVSHMTLFNSQGNVPKVQAFWQQKLPRIAAAPVRVYGETSHLLAKAGLMENLPPLLARGEVSIICLTRNIDEIVASLKKRYDFLNKGNMWLWHLDPDYPRKIVAVQPFRRWGVDGQRLWYTLEMFARMAYYRQLMAGTPGLRFIDADIGELSQAQKVSELLEALGEPRAAADIRIPERSNVATGSVDAGFQEALRKLLASIRFDADALAAEFIARGGRF